MGGCDLREVFQIPLKTQRNVDLKPDGIGVAAVEDVVGHSTPDQHVLAGTRRDNLLVDLQCTFAGDDEDASSMLRWMWR